MNFGNFFWGGGVEGAESSWIAQGLEKLEFIGDCFVVCLCLLLII